jgi:CheY-like chemotaxis protein
MGRSSTACHGERVESAYHPVLVVEDDVAVCGALVALLEASGYEAVGVRDGTEAFRLLQEGLRPRMIFLDLSMPEMDGEHFRLVQLRHERLAAIPVVILSGRPDAKEVARSLRTPGVLEKPVDGDVLLHAVEEHGTRSWPPLR